MLGVAYLRGTPLISTSFKSEVHRNLPSCIGVLFGGFLLEKSMAIPGLPGGFSSSTREIHPFPLKGHLCPVVCPHVFAWALRRKAGLLKRKAKLKEEAAAKEEPRRADISHVDTWVAVLLFLEGEPV